MNPTLVTGTPLFSEVPRRRRGQVAALVDEVDVPAGKTVIHEGVYARELFVIVDGSADVTIDGEHVARLGRGQVFGELGLLEGPTRAATVVSRSPMRLLVIGRRELATLMHRFPSVSDRVRAAAAARTAAAA